MINRKRYQGVVLPHARRDDEHDLQCACVHWFRLTYPSISTLLFAVPNGGARNMITGAKLKAEGVTAGVADLILLVPHKKPVFLELKTKIGRQSDSQKEWQNAVVNAGYAYHVIRTLDEFITIAQDSL